MGMTTALERLILANTWHRVESVPADAVWLALHFSP